MKKNIFAALLLMAAMQAVNAQKVVLHMAGNQKFECNVLQLDSITFEDDGFIVVDEHEWVDLGLPSGTLWATCNVGANSPEEYGDYFAWGETKPKENYSVDTYNYSGFVVIQDAATENWGYGWETPSIEHFQELINAENTTTEWITQNGVKGRLITSKKNGESIFLPAAGCIGEFSLLAGSYGEYWSSTLYADDINCSYAFSFDETYCGYGNGRRDYGRTIRPVRVKTR